MICKVLGAFGVLMALMLTVGCGGGRPVQLGREVPEAGRVRVAEVLDRPEAFLGKTVVVEGRVGQVCQSMGCWFVLKDGERQVVVDLEGGKLFTVPRDVSGDSVRAMGVVKRVGPDLRVIGKGVEIRPTGG